MFLSSENRKRHAFLENSIGNARDAFANNPHMQQRLGKFAAFYTDTCDRLIIADVRHGQVRLPAKYQNTDHLPVIAQPPDKTLTLLPPPPHFYPRQRLSVQRTLRAWAPNPPIEEVTDALETFAWHYARQVPPATIAPYKPESKIAAHVVSPAISIRVKPAIFRNGGKNPVKVILSRPLLAIPYYGPTSATPTPATFAHEFTHIGQVEANMLDHYLEPDDPKAQKQHYRGELKANYVGACAAMASLDAGLTMADLPKPDASQIRIEQVRLDVISSMNMQHRDEFEPTGTLINAMQKAGIDLIGQC